MNDWTDAAILCGIAAVGGLIWMYVHGRWEKRHKRNRKR